MIVPLTRTSKITSKIKTISLRNNFISRLEKSKFYMKIMARSVNWINERPSKPHLRVRVPAWSLTHAVIVLQFLLGVSIPPSDPSGSGKRMKLKR